MIFTLKYKVSNQKHKLTKYKVNQSKWYWQLKFVLLKLNPIQTFGSYITFKEPTIYCLFIGWKYWTKSKEGCQMLDYRVLLTHTWCHSNWPTLAPVMIRYLSLPESKFDGLVQERRNSIANALELRLSCNNPSSRSIINGILWYAHEECTWRPKFGNYVDWITATCQRDQRVIIVLAHTFVKPIFFLPWITTDIRIKIRISNIDNYFSSFTCHPWFHWLKLARVV